MVTSLSDTDVIAELLQENPSETKPASKPDVNDPQLQLERFLQRLGKEISDPAKRRLTSIFSAKDDVHLTKRVAIALGYTRIDEDNNRVYGDINLNGQVRHKLAPDASDDAAMHEVVVLLSDNGIFVGTCPDIDGWTAMEVRDAKPTQNWVHAPSYHLAVARLILLLKERRGKGLLL